MFELSSANKERTLYNFKGGNDAFWPYSGVARDASGNLYGTTFAGGSDNKGTVYKITP